MNCGNHVLVTIEACVFISLSANDNQTYYMYNRSWYFIFRTTSCISIVHFKTKYSRHSYDKRILDMLWETIAKSNVRYFAFVSLLIVLISYLNIIISYQCTNEYPVCFLLLYLYEQRQVYDRGFLSVLGNTWDSLVWAFKISFLWTFLFELLIHFGRLRSPNAVGISVETLICINSTDSSILWYTGSIYWEKWFDCFEEVIFKYVLLLPFRDG